MNQNHARRNRARKAALGLSALVLLSAAPAHAQSPTPAPAVEMGAGLLDAGSTDMQGLSERYSSLSGALTVFYADQKGMSVDQFIKENPLAVAQLLGASSVEQVQGLPTADLPKDTTTGGTDLAALNKQLSMNGLAVDTSAYTNLDSAAQAVAANASSIDTAVISAGSQWAQQMAGLRVPALKNPNAPAVNTQLATAMPKEGLVFGMFLDKSLTAMVADFPDVFSQVQRSGLGTPASQQAWNTSMQRAYASSQPDFSSMLPSKCAAGMLAVMASGNTSDATKYGDSSGAAAGLYLNSQMSRLFNPGGTSTLPNANDNVINPTEWNRLQEFQKNMILQQNPDLAATLKNSVGGSTAPTGCTSSSAATKGALKSTLPGVFANLQR